MAKRTLILYAAPAILLLAEDPASWPQFRGPNATGVAADKSTVPVEFNPSKGVLWKQALPPGHSSPAIWGDRIFLTGFDKDSKKLEVLCLAKKDGEILWRRPLAPEQIQKTHAVNSPATATPAVDAARVYAYFASYGLIAFDHAGKQLWTVPLPIPSTTQGSGTSPIVTGDRLILNHDATEGGYLLAVDARSGRTVWKTGYPADEGSAAESYSTPVIWNDQLVLHRFGVVEAYSVKDGKRTWWVNATSTGTSTVVAAKDMIYAATWDPFGEADQVSPLPDFAALVKANDKDGNGRISRNEIPDDLKLFARPDVPNVPGAGMSMKSIFRDIDQNGDGAIQEAEWTTAMGFTSMRKDHGVLAIRPEGEGDITSKVVWTAKIAVPEVPSPLLHGNRLYLVRNGGIVSCLDAPSGKVIYRGRVGAGGPYYASPISANGRIYIASGEGTIAVLSSGDELKVVARNDLKEEIFATPAAVGGTLYVRTAGHLYAFGNK